MPAVGPCSHGHCYAPDVACVLGLDSCPHLRTSEDATADAQVIRDGRRLPWTGLALGLDDLPAVVALGRAHLVAVVGAAGAGKTTALAAHWLSARRGEGPCGRGFAGSYTLLGWHRIARHLEWGATTGGFPPHTTAADGRLPALLHYATASGGSVRHVLYADVPGEWYRAWAMDVDAVPGARWVAEHATAFVLLADTAALVGPDRGRARAGYTALARRVQSEAAGRPVVPVRTKADTDMKEPWRAQVEDLNWDLFGMATTAVSAREGAARPLTEVAGLGTKASFSVRAADLIDPDPGSDPFLRYRSRMGMSHKGML